MREAPKSFVFRHFRQFLSKNGLSVNSKKRPRIRAAFYTFYTNIFLTL